MSQFNYTITYKPGKQNTVAYALSRRPDYEEPSYKYVYFADQRELPLYTLHYFDSSLVADFIEDIPGQNEGDLLDNIQEHTAVHKGSKNSKNNTEQSISELISVPQALDSAAAVETFPEGQTFLSLKDNADKPLVGFTRVENKDGFHVCSEQENHVGWTNRIKGHHPSSKVGFLTSIVLEPGWIARVGSAQQIAIELSKYRELTTSVENDEFEYRTVEDVRVLYRKVHQCAQLVLPKNDGFRQLLLEELHASKLAGHLGIRKILSALQKRVWWPGIIQPVIKFIKACLVYQRTKDSASQPQGLLHPLPVPTTRFESISMDFVTDLSLVETSSSFGTMKCNAIFTIVDRLTKFARLVPCYFSDSHMSTQETARLFVDNFMRLFGVPANVVHDCNPRFTAAFWKDLWQILGSKVLAFSSHHPQTDGQTERAHSSIEQIIWVHVLETNSDMVWITTLLFIEFAMTSSKNNIANTTPFELVFGYLPSSLVNRIVGISNVSDFQQFVQNMAAAVETAKSLIVRALGMVKTVF